MRHRDQIVRRDQILSQVWEWNAEITSNVVAAQVRLLQRKLVQTGCTDPMETIYGLGYRFDSNLQINFSNNHE